MANPTDTTFKEQKILNLVYNPTAQALDIVDVVGNSLVPSEYDYISLSYTGSNLTGVVYKNGGASGTTASTLTLAYDGSDNLISITKT